MNASSARAEPEIASWLERSAEASPERDALRWPRGSGFARMRFAELAERAAALATGLRRAGLAPGDRACVFLRPGPSFVCAFHALLRAGAVPVLIDPGMGRASLLACVERTRPRALIGVPKAMLARHLYRRAFRSVELLVSDGPRWLWEGHALEALARTRGAPLPSEARARDAEAAILFTSGSTGPPKGVVYTQPMFAAQLEALQQLYGFAPGEIDAACFPLFALFDNALGMTTLFPPVDPSRPASCDPAAVHRAIEHNGASRAFASPAVWARLVPWAQRARARFHSLASATSAGAAVPARLVEGLAGLLSGAAQVHTPYGATEALPVASIEARELLGAVRARSASGGGTCVGRAAPGIEIRAIRVEDGPIARFARELELARGAIGELCVRGAVVTQLYADAPEATALAKIAALEPGAPAWHRMGDLGYLDEQGRVWLCGRKSERIETARGTLYPLPAENAVDAVEGVRRSALVGVGPRGRERAVLLVEAPGLAPAALERLRALPLPQPAGEARPADEVRTHAGFPLDARHNAKIRRDRLRAELEARE